MLKFLTRTRPRVFSEVLAYAQIPDLIAKGYLCQPTYQIVQRVQARRNCRSTRPARTTPTTSVKRHYKRIGFDDRVRRVVLRLLAGRAEVRAGVHPVRGRGRGDAAAVPGAAVVTAKTKPKEREAIIAAFRRGRDQGGRERRACCRLGFDFPELETVVLARPTLSLALYYQQVGRLLRPPRARPTRGCVDMVDQVASSGGSRICGCSRAV